MVVRKSDAARKKYDAPPSKSRQPSTFHPVTNSEIEGNIGGLEGRVIVLTKEGPVTFKSFSWRPCWHSMLSFTGTSETSNWESTRPSLGWFPRPEKCASTAMKFRENFYINVTRPSSKG